MRDQFRIRPDESVNDAVVARVGYRIGIVNHVYVAVIMRTLIERRSRVIAGVSGLTGAADLEHLRAHYKRGLRRFTNDYVYLQGQTEVQEGLQGLDRAAALNDCLNNHLYHSVRLLCAPAVPFATLGQADMRPCAAVAYSALWHVSQQARVRIRKAAASGDAWPVGEHWPNLSD